MKWFVVNCAELFLLSRAGAVGLRKLLTATRPRIRPTNFGTVYVNTRSGLFRHWLCHRLRLNNGRLLRNEGRCAQRGSTKCGSATDHSSAKRDTTTGSDTEYGSGMFDQSSTFTADRAGLFNLTGGTNTLGIYQRLGLLRHRLSRVPAIHAARRSCRFRRNYRIRSANQNTQMLMNYLTGIYGQQNAGRPSARRKPEFAVSQFDVSQSLGRAEARDSRLGLHRVFAVTNCSLAPTRTTNRSSRLPGRNKTMASSA